MSVVSSSFLSDKISACPESGSAPTVAMPVYYGILFNVFFLLAISDVTSVSLGGGNVRWAWVFLPFLFFLLPKRKDPKGMLLLTMLLFVTHVAASFISGFVVKGLIYSVWIWINYLFFFRAGYLIAGELREGVWAALLWGGRAQIVLGVVLVLLGVHERARFVYFEPSYLAIGLVPYLFVSLFWSREKWLDGIFLLILVIFNQSANMVVAMVVAMLYWLVVNRRVWISVIFLVFAILVGYISYRVVLDDPASPNHGVAVWVADNGVNLDMIYAIIGRAGNRAPRFQAAMEMLQGHWLNGFGPGVYVDITANRDFDHITDGLEYLDPAGLPVINVLLEAVSNAGVLAAVVLIVVFLYVMFLVIVRVNDNDERRVMIGAMLAFGVMLQFESSYLRAYVWLAFGIFVARALHLRVVSIVPAGKETA